jgi:aryl-alcohol dehydrogenase-like predicted oxidoreductase
MIPQRKLGKNGPDVSALGIGCFAAGGVSRRGDTLHGWTGTDDAEVVRAMERAIDLGVTLIDTADVYGAGHAERLLAGVLKGKRDGLVIATKFSKIFDETARTRSDGTDVSPAYVRAACEGSLRRMGIDVIDLYQLHEGDMDLALVDDLLDTLEGLVAAGKIRHYGWSTDRPERAEAFARGPHCVAIQQRLNIVEGNWATLKVCERMGLASICRSPMATGLLTGKYTAQTTFDAADLRANWDLGKGARAQQLKALDTIRGLLTSDGRSIAQGALGWLLAKSDATIPIPGFKTVAQVEDNIGTLQRGPLAADVMTEIDAALQSVLPAKAA